MSEMFDARKGLVLLTAEIIGPKREVIVRLALDTGATATLIKPNALIIAGYDLTNLTDEAQVTTGSELISVPRITVRRIIALDVQVDDLSVLAHAVPKSARIDGVLGLDFFRGKRLTIDFQVGEITLESPI